MKRELKPGKIYRLKEAEYGVPDEFPLEAAPPGTMVRLITTNGVMAYVETSTGIRFTTPITNLEQEHET